LSSDATKLWTDASEGNDGLVEELRRETPGCANRIHFNNAGAGLMPQGVLDAVKRHLDFEAAIGGYEAAVAAAEAIDRFYTTVATLIGCAPECVAYCASATDAYTRALSSVTIAGGGVVLTTRDDYVSNQIAFMSLAKRFGARVVHAPNARDGGVDVDELAKLVHRYRPALVAVTHVPTNSGLVQPVVEIGAVCRDAGVLYLVDACQTVGQLPLDVSLIGCDFLTATGRKFLRGPRGSGFLYVSPRALAAGLEPLFIDIRGAEWTEPHAYRTRPTAKRFEERESAFAIKIGLSTAVEYALKVGVDCASLRAVALANSLRTLIEGIPGVRLLDRGQNRCAIVTATVAGVDGHEFHRALEARGVNSSVSVRSVAQLDFSEKGVEWAIRLSPHYYNTRAEVEAVASAVAEAATDNAT
jgi:selenocysteine lyase/cysteine desulfurase